MEELEKVASVVKALSTTIDGALSKKIPGLLSEVGSLLGVGGNNAAFAVRGMDDAVLRVPKGHLAQEVAAINPTFRQATTSLPPGSPINIGQITHVNDQGFEMMKRSPGIPAGAKYGKDVPKDEKLSTYLESIRRIAALPQGAFDSHLKRIDHLSKRYDIHPDPSKSGNFLIDPVRKRINTIDTIPGHSRPGPYSVSNLSVPLVDTGFLNSIRGKTELARRDKAAIRLTLTKMRNAAKNNTKIYGKDFMSQPEEYNDIVRMPWSEFDSSLLKPYVPKYSDTPPSAMDTVW